MFTGYPVGVRALAHISGKIALKSAFCRRHLHELSQSVGEHPGAPSADAATCALCALSHIGAAFKGKQWLLARGFRDLRATFLELLSGDPS